MVIKKVLEQKEWDDFVLLNGEQFLQSWQWGEFQKNLGRKIWRMAVYENNEIVAAALIVKYKLLFNKSYFYSPRGPIIEESGPPAGGWNLEYGILLEEIKKLAEEEGVIFWRFESPNSKFQILNSKKVADVQPSKTVILDLKKTSDEIFTKMHSKTRYNIRLAEKQGVKIYEKTGEGAEVFLKLLKETSLRDQFRAHPDNYYSHLLNFNPQFVRLYVAEYENKILAANLMIFSSKTTTYLHGASSNLHRNVMAPYLLHWFIIQEAVKNGYFYYDFWGIDEKKWPGVTRFKKGFNGEEVIYPGTFDLPFSNFWYNVYRVGKMVKKI
ncbi:MAG: peptidoglycan bridge formation glycyltransferase FemA/FemB family protein [Patescibacteria group bacterium]|jgi:lipid II:glycine glycyltransferase (peptidoglycan interpeptide bridge formation enzyme)